MTARPTKRPAKRPESRDSATLCTRQVTIIGVGGVGRQLALQLVALGVAKLTVIDSERVKEHHVRSAGYLADDVGAWKVDAVGSLCHQTNPQLDFTGINDRVRPHHPRGDAVFCCVDALSARKDVWRCAASDRGFWADVRFDRETIQVLTAVDDRSRRAYAASLAVARPAKRTTPLICEATIGASLAVEQFLRYLRGKLSRDVRLDLTSGWDDAAHDE
ncbi:MAG: ThiF family adenylyltransferase [Planctomycetaceae bacterium]|nr:ThiF family adenylyltransferase [Planctomycetaceae bacterium]